jgi:hypothetical protein
MAFLNIWKSDTTGFDANFKKCTVNVTSNVRVLFASIILVPSVLNICIYYLLHLEKQLAENPV